ncbi:MAG: GyrI-like domain-containing protein [Thermoplasmata archaeon]|nr:GyrI-like domain-containing protein [Thermoplasmata archaeon]
MKKIDFKKELKHLYAAGKKEVVTIEVPELNFLMIDGQGDPNTSQDYKDAIETLFSVSYDIKFSIKKGTLAIDYGVMPLEGLWWVDDMSKFDINKKDDWKWTAMIMQPGNDDLEITQEIVDASIQKVKKKKDLPALPKLRFEKYEEGPSAQIMHIGPFSEEGPTIKKIHDHIKENVCKPRGKHHEIYLSDFRRAAPEKLKTIIRQPFECST